jgi:hypothetical protein
LAVAEPAAAQVESWKGLFTAATALLRPRSALTQIAVSPMSAEWLREYDASAPKHSDSDR